jgi:hypothetical protein
MLDYVISSFYPEIQATHASNSDRVQRSAAFFREVGRGHTVVFPVARGSEQHMLLNTVTSASVPAFLPASSPPAPRPSHPLCPYGLGSQ